MDKPPENYNLRVDFSEVERGGELYHRGEIILDIERYPRYTDSVLIVTAEKPTEEFCRLDLYTRFSELTRLFTIFEKALWRNL